MSEKIRIEFIVNPISGTNDKGHILSLIEKDLNKDVFDYTVSETQYAGHAVELAHNASEQQVDIVVAIGGDGTVNEIARSLVHTNTALGVIPCGSGNGLARHLQIPMEAKKAIEVLNHHVIDSLDYGKINGQPFFCTCGVGFDAFMSYKFANSTRRGIRTYVENALREGLKYKPETYELEDESGNYKYKAFLIACANASQYGNNAYIAPNASMSDGLMDVTIMEPFTMIEAPQIAFQLFNKLIDKNSRIKTFRCKKLIIHRKQSGIVHFDGDPILTGKDVEVELIEKGLKVVINDQAIQRPAGMLPIFDDFFDDLIAMRSEIMKTNKRLLSLNKELLHKLTPNKKDNRKL
jgi:diacylglycerol kinase (ATP)